MNQRVKYFDILNILSCFAVVCLHHNNLVHHWENSSVWAQTLVVQTLCYWSVPMFLMLSGATLLPYRQRYDTPTFFKKRGTRILLPFLFWSAILTLINNEVPKIDFSHFINDVLGYSAMPIYYFFPLILSMYLLVPVISLLVENRCILWYLVILIFIGDSVLYPIGNIIGLENIHLYRLPVKSPFLFLLLGYLLATQNVKKQYRILIYVLALFGMLFRYWWTFYFSAQEKILDHTWYDYVAFPNALLVCAVFLWIKYSHFYDKWNPQLLSLMASCSLGIYLLHFLFMNVEANLFGMQPDNAFWRWGMPFLTYLICLGTVFALKQLPFVKHLLP